MEHIPVLLEETVEGLRLSPGDTVIDATLGMGGHAKAILGKIGPSGHLYGFDRDLRNLELAKQQLAAFPNVTFVHDSFGNMNKHDLPSVQAIVFDLGFSSLHVDDASRGFSFQQEGPLDMRYDTRQEVSAETIVNGWAKEELAELFRIYGEEPRARKIAQAIFDARRKQRFTTTAELADLISSVIPRRGRMHPATRVFQALRMAVNDELGEVERGVNAAVSLLTQGGVIGIITFHSLEDRLVKKTFKSCEALEVLTKKPIVPTFEETKHNPRARSAKLRLARKI